MTNDQRKFLIEQVNKTAKKEIEELEESIPVKPSLNNYLIASFLDDTVKFNSLEKLKTKMREGVLRFGTGDTLLVQRERGYGHFRKNSDEEEEYVQLSAHDLFVIPSNYKEALKEYEQKKAEVDKKIKAVEADRDTIILKLQIGSNAVLDKIITQVDNMGDLQLFNTKFLLSEGTK